jgi:HK97 family phage major capsid protein
MYDYRTIEQRTKVLEAEVTALSEISEPTQEQRERFTSLMAEIHANERIVGEMKDAEIEELRATVANASKVGVVDTSAEELKAFHAYLRTGEVMASLTTSPDSAGGFIVPEPAHAMILDKPRKADPIFSRATSFDMAGDTVLKLPTKATHGAVSNAAETGARSQQAEPTFSGPELTCYDYYTDQRISQQFLDSVGDVESLLMGWIGEDIMEQASADAVIGNGTTKIKGLFTEPYAQTLSGTAGALSNTGFLKAYFALPASYRASADCAWIMSGATLSVVAAMAHPASSTVPLATQTGDSWTILGKPVLESDSAPAIGAANLPVAFGDIRRGYAVGVHRNTVILRDPFTATPLVRFYGVARLGGCAWDRNAMILIKSNNS